MAKLCQESWKLLEVVKKKIRIQIQNKTKRFEDFPKTCETFGGCERWIEVENFIWLIKLNWSWKL